MKKYSLIVSGFLLALIFIFPINSYSAKDSQAPYIVSSSPRQYQQDIKLNTIIVVEYNEIIQKGTGINGIALVNSSNNEVTVNTAIDKKKLIIKPKSPLAYDTAYKVVVPNRAVKDAAGNYAKYSYRINFVTISQPVSFSNKDVEIEKEIRKELGKPSGSITMKDIQSIYALNLNDCGLSDIGSLPRMPNLSQLNLSNNQLSDINAVASVLKTLPRLTYLNICGNKISNTYKLFSIVPGLKTIEQYDMSWQRQDIGKLKLMEEKVQYLLSLIKPDMSDLQKELTIHDYLVQNTEYDFDNFKKGEIPAESYTPFGVLVKGKGVCQGYAETANLLLNMAGVESTMVSGTANGYGGNGGHAWNIVKINGQYYHLDVTWDDPVPDAKGRVRYNYFNVTDKEIEKDHQWNSKETPKCTTESILNGKSVLCFQNEYRYAYFIDETTLYRIDLTDPTQKQEIKVLTYPSQLVRLDGDTMYMSLRSNWFSIYKLKLDGSEYRSIKDFQLNSGLDNFYVKNGWIYMVLGDRITKMRDDRSELQDVFTAPEGYSISDTWQNTFDGEWIYYDLYNDNESNSKVSYKVSVDGTKNIRLHN